MAGIVEGNFGINKNTIADTYFIANIDVGRIIGQGLFLAYALLQTNVRLSKNT